MSSYSQQRWIYSQRPQGRVGTEHYRYVEQAWAPSLARDEVLLRAKYFSVDPYMRIQQHEKPNWEQPHPLNTVQGGAVVGQVLESQHPEFAEGDWVSAYTGWQSHALVHGSELEKLDPEQAALDTALGVLGMPGRTAWFGLMEVGQPKAGDVVVVSGAAGAVGSLVCQFALKNGCSVVAIAGSAEKCAWLESLGVQTTINYRQHDSAESLQAEIIARAGGIDVYFDNVGGWISDAVIMSLNLRARVVICGQISQYDGGLDTPETGPRLMHQLLYKRARIEGVLARDFSHRMDEMRRIVAPWLAAGEIEFKTTVSRGFESLPETLGSLFNGANIGKAIVEV